MPQCITELVSRMDAFRLLFHFALAVLELKGSAEFNRYVESGRGSPPYNLRSRTAVIWKLGLTSAP